MNAKIRTSVALKISVSFVYFLIVLFVSMIPARI